MLHVATKLATCFKIERCFYAFKGTSAARSRMQNIQVDKMHAAHVHIQKLHALVELVPTIVAHLAQQMH